MTINVNRFIEKIYRKPAKDRLRDIRKKQKTEKTTEPLKLKLLN
jgi:hypothetical protein